MQPNRIRAALEALRPIAGDHVCAAPIYRLLDAGADHASLIEAAQHLVVCDTHDRHGGMQVILDLLATILDYGGNDRAPKAHPERAFAILGEAHGRAYAEAIACMWMPNAVPIDDLRAEVYAKLDSSELVR